MNTPSVSVIMPVYNAEAYVAESIGSILGQTHTDLELIIVDDGSTDRSRDVVRSITDPRVIHIEQANKGVAAALNTALALTKGALIARQDADDVSLPTRLERQLQRFREEPELAICGTWATITDATGEPTGAHEHPTDHAHIRYRLLFDSQFVSSSVMMRASILAEVGCFDTDQRVFEDYDLWSRIARAGRTANLPEHLVKYRVLHTGLSHTTHNADERVVEQRRRNLRHGDTITEERIVELSAHTGITHQHVNSADLRAVHHFLLGHIDRLTRDGAERRSLRAELKQRLMGFHLVPHTGTVSSVLDRLSKEFVLCTTSLE